MSNKTLFIISLEIGKVSLTQHLQDCFLCLVVPVPPHIFPRSHQRLSPPGGRHQLPAHHGVHEDQRQERQEEEDDGGELIQVEGSLQHPTEGRGEHFLVRKIWIPTVENLSQLNCTFP